MHKKIHERWKFGGPGLQKPDLGGPKPQKPGSGGVKLKSEKNAFLGKNPHVSLEWNSGFLKKARKTGVYRGFLHFWRFLTFFTIFWRFLRFFDGFWRFWRFCTFFDIFLQILHNKRVQRDQRKHWWMLLDHCRRLHSQDLVLGPARTPSTKVPKHGGSKPGPPKRDLRTCNAWKMCSMLWEIVMKL